MVHSTPLNDTHFEFPCLSSIWPTSYSTNADPNAADILQASGEWMSDVHSRFVADESWKRKFSLCNFGLLTSFWAPKPRGGHFRACADWSNYTFTYDDIFESMDPDQMERELQCTINVMKDPHSAPSNDESALTSMTREFWARTVDESNATASSIQRFITTYEDYLHAVIQEVRDGDKGVIRDIDQYLILRRHTGGAYPSFILASITEEIPQLLWEHPKVQALTALGCEIFAIANDLCSFVSEYTRGQLHNAVISTLLKKGCGVQKAIDHVYELYKTRTETFLATKASILQIPNIDTGVFSRYCEGMEYGIKGYIQWAITTPRYFGTTPRQSGMSFVVELPALTKRPVFQLPDASKEAFPERVEIGRSLEVEVMTPGMG
ncbi:isoprenoid synthase domain-containing protein [Mycena capillaripes]|nr:isoprenoid synthase domain-containing protein [Mycena capillaripes]